MPQRWAGIGLFFIAIFSSWLVWHYVFTLALAPPSNPNFPDAFVDNLEVIVMNDLGERQYQFFSPTMTHYAQNDRTQFSQPKLTLFETAQPPWIVTADNGESLNGNNTVNLMGNVKMLQAAGKNNPSTIIKTTQATLLPKVRVVTTDQYISAVQPLAEVDSVGMKLDLMQQTLDLLSQVHGYYAQPKTK